MTVKELLEGLQCSVEKGLTVSDKLACMGGIAQVHNRIERGVTAYKEMYDRFLYFQSESEADKLAERALWLAENALSVAAWAHKYSETDE